MQTTSTSTSKITISGLLGFTNPDSSAQNALAVTAASVSAYSLFADDSAKWTKDTGTLVFTVGNGKKLSAGKMYAFQVRLSNPFVEQTSPDVTLQASGETNLLPLRMQKAGGESAPLFITKPKLVVAKVSACTALWCLGTCTALKGCQGLNN